MTGLLLILKLFGGLILLYILARIVGHFFKLDKYYEDIHKYKNEDIRRSKNEDIKRSKNEDDQNFTN